MNQSFSISLGQFLAFIALGIGLAFGMYFIGEAIVAECRRWGKWREARRLVRQAEATEAMQRYRARLIEEEEREHDIINPVSANKERELFRQMQQLNDLMGGKK